jgi:hypothetical protein
MRRQTKSPSPQTERASPEEPATNNDDAVPRLLRREPVPIEEREEAYLKARYAPLPIKLHFQSSPRSHLHLSSLCSGAKGADLQRRSGSEEATRWK